MMKPRLPEPRRILDLLGHAGELNVTQIHYRTGICTQRLHPILWDLVTKGLIECRLDARDWPRNRLYKLPPKKEDP